ncbi:MAG: glycosyltransferase family 4 protein [Clostridiales bacterium]|nr:glycosyltransferase family 4 protein [Clostridiales bacterium]
MKVLQVCAYAPPYEGNFIKSLKALGKKLAEDGYEMIYALPDSARDITWCRALAQETAVYFLPLSKARIRMKTYRMLRWIYRENPDIAIIHSHFELYDIPVTMTAPKHVMVFWHLHDAISNYADFKNRMICKIQYRYLHKSSILLSVSQKHMAYVLRLGFPAGQARYVPNGLDTDRILMVTSPYAARPYDFLIFGWDFERKGVDLGIRAMELLPGNVCMGVVGDANTPRRITELHHNAEGVEVLEPVADINGLYEKSKCFLHISRAEGLSYALLEAVYAGLPVICSDIEENRFAERFPTVHMVRNKNVEDIRDAMQLRLQADACSSEQIMQSRQLIEEEYSISRWVKDMLDCYGVKHD